MYIYPTDLVCFNDIKRRACCQVRIFGLFQAIILYRNLLQFRLETRLLTWHVFYASMRRCL